jgi:DNA-binding phage protein
MTDIIELRKRMDDSGMTFTAIAEKSGMLRETLYNRLKTGDFKVSEICALSVVLHLSIDDRNKIFFDENSE